MEQQTKTNLLNIETWVRLLYMLVFGLLSVVARMVIWIVAILQFLLVLVTGTGNDNLRDLGQGTSKWVYQTFLFLTFNSDDKPFPFSDWPEVEAPLTEELQTDGVIDAEFVEAETTEKPADADDVPAFVDTEDEQNPQDDHKPT
ncbi:MAG: DUF4389 domain-containing protein [Porticoccus sp.]|nr:DUF4389 domain-containing protein [Porticoccus sp.]